MDVIDLNCHLIKKAEKEKTPCCSHKFEKVEMYYTYIL